MTPRIPVLAAALLLPVSALAQAPSSAPSLSSAYAAASARAAALRRAAPAQAVPARLFHPHPEKSRHSRGASSEYALCSRE